MTDAHLMEISIRTGHFVRPLETKKKLDRQRQTHRKPWGISSEGIEIYQIAIEGIEIYQIPDIIRFTTD
jgi:hypothetical protein